MCAPPRSPTVVLCPFGATTVRRSTGKERTMRRQHGVRMHPIRHGSNGTHRIQVILVSDDPSTGQALFASHMRTRRRDAVSHRPLGRVDAPDAAPIIAAPNPLSTREREVLGMLARGLPNKEIARLLYIADRTVKFHAQAIYRKLNVAN